MNYVQFHVGDWDSSTRLLSPLEKGVYIDLLMLYYSVERPLMRSECERISRAYAPNEKAALEYVLERFFHLEDGVYTQHRCDEEIAKAAEKSMKAAKSAQARWNKGSKGKKASGASANDMQNGCTCNTDVDANGMRTHSERSADAMLTNNQEPITKNQPVERVNPVTTTGGDFCPTVDDFGAEPEAVPEPPPVAGTGVTRTPLYPFPDSLPEDWAIAAAKRRPDVSAEAVFLKLRDRLRERYPGEKRTMAMWLRQFLQWITTERVIGKPLGREETPEEKQKSIENAERFAAAMRKRLEEANR